MLRLLRLPSVLQLVLFPFAMTPVKLAYVMFLTNFVLPFSDRSALDLSKDVRVSLRPSDRPGVSDGVSVHSVEPEMSPISRPTVSSVELVVGATPVPSVGVEVTTTVGDLPSMDVTVDGSVANG